MFPEIAQLAVTFKQCRFTALLLYCSKEMPTCKLCQVPKPTAPYSQPSECNIKCNTTKRGITVTFSHPEAQLFLQQGVTVDNNAGLEFPCHSLQLLALALPVVLLSQRSHLTVVWTIVPRLEYTYKICSCLKVYTGPMNITKISCGKCHEHL